MPEEKKGMKHDQGKIMLSLIPMDAAVGNDLYKDSDSSIESAYFNAIFCIQKAKYDEALNFLRYLAYTLENEICSIRSGSGMYSPAAIYAVAQVMTYGAQKYAMNSWQIVENGIERYLSALGRHLWHDPRGIDGLLVRKTGINKDDFGLPHRDHALCNAYFLIHLLSRELEK